MSARRVSVVVPTCDRPALLREALASIRARESEALSFEIIVGDNGQAAETKQVAAEFGAKHLAVSRKGPSAARNACLKAATGEFIAFLDDDDIWTTEHLVPHIRLLDANSELDGVFAQAVHTDVERRPKADPWPAAAPANGEDLLRQMLSGLFPQIGAVVVRASVPERYGLLDEELIGGEDLDWLLRVARRRRLGYAHVLGVKVRVRPPDVMASFDATAWTRVGFDRLVFYRHAVPEWRLWSSPFAFFRAYRGTLDHLYWYFMWAGTERAERNDRAGALRASWCAFRVFPLRTLGRFFVHAQFRNAMLIAFFGQTRSRAV